MFVWKINSSSSSSISVKGFSISPAMYLVTLCAVPSCLYPGCFSVCVMNSSVVPCGLSQNPTCTYGYAVSTVNYELSYTTATIEQRWIDRASIGIVGRCRYRPQNSDALRLWR